MYRAKVTSKGQVTIPKELRAKMGIKEGDYLQIKESPTGYIIEKQIEEEQIIKYVGILKKKGNDKNTDKIIGELRGE